MDIQIALDFFDLENALELAETVIKEGADYLEIGTTLIAGEGLEAVRLVRKNFPDAPIVVDFKTMDGGKAFSNKAANKGADVVTVMAAAHDATITYAKKACKDKNISLEVDLLGIADEQIEERAKEVELRGADIIMVHTPVDRIRMEPSINPIRNLSKVINAVESKISVACTSEKYCSKAKSMGVDTAVVGPSDIESKNIPAFIDKMKQ